MDNYRYKYKKYKMKYKQQIGSGKETITLQNNIKEIHNKKKQLQRSHNHHYRKTIEHCLERLLDISNQLLKLNQKWMSSKKTKLQKEELNTQLEKQWELYYQLENKRVEGASRGKKVREISEAVNTSSAIDYHKSKLLHEIQQMEDLEKQQHASKNYEDQQRYGIEIKEIDNRINVLWRERMERQEELADNQMLQDFKREHKNLLLTYANILYDSGIYQDWTGDTMNEEELDECRDLLQQEYDDYDTPWDYIRDGLGTVEMYVGEYENHFKKKIDLEKQNKEVPNLVESEVNRLGNEIIEYYHKINMVLIDCLETKLKCGHNKPEDISDMKKMIKWLKGDKSVELPSHNTIHDVNQLL